MFQSIKQFLKPDWRKILIFAVFLFIAFAGSIQSWVFRGKDAGEPKPLFFDLLKPIPFWPIWVLLILPLTFIKGYFGLFWVIQLIYFYLFSCLIIFIWDKLTKKR